MSTGDKPGSVPAILKLADVELAGVLPIAALDERVAIVGTSGSGKTYAAKGWVELLLDAGARVCIVDPLGVWWGLRAGADGIAPGYPVVVFGGRHADVGLDEGMGVALGRLVGGHQLACVIDLSELGSGAARRRFMLAFAEALYEANTEPLPLVLDEADLWAPQRPQPDGYALLGRIEEIVRRGRVRGFIPWLITQRPAVVHKDVLSQADILVAMKLTSSQDRDAIGGWIEGQADRAEGKRILATLPKLARGNGYIWAPADGVLEWVGFPAIRTYDSSRTPRRGERIGAPRTLADVDLSAITAFLGEGREQSDGAADDAVPLPKLRRQLAERGSLLAAAQARVAELEVALARLERDRSAQDERLDRIARLATATIAHASPSASPSEGDTAPTRHVVPDAPAASHPVHARAIERRSSVEPSARSDAAAAVAAVDLHPAARKLLAALAQHVPARFTWGQAATLAGLKPTGGHYNAGRKQLRDLDLVDEAANLVAASGAGLDTAGAVPPAPSTSAERLSLWCERLPSPAPEMLRALAAQGERYTEAIDLAATLGKKPTGGHWNGGLALLRNNGLVEVDGKRLRASTLFR